jgi:hypothetical protein
MFICSIGNGTITYYILTFSLPFNIIDRHNCIRYWTCAVHLTVFSKST